MTLPELVADIPADSCVGRCIADLAERYHVGMARYGEPLDPIQPRFASLAELKAELQDALVYLDAYERNRGAL